MKKAVKLDQEWTFERIRQANKELEGAHPDQILKWAREHFGSKLVLGTGFGPSGMFLIHRIYQQELDIQIFYLDTHLLFDETYALRDKLEDRYNISITRVSTDLSLEDQGHQYGEELWKTDPNRCCYLRKVLPLKNFLSDKEAWITGVRRSQSETRQKTQVVEWDPEHEVVKINPLASWTGEEVWDYIHINELPYNPMHDEGYPSIGCIPCTVPVDTNDDERAGRWQGLSKTECGIHVTSQRYQNDFQNNLSTGS